MRLPAYFWPKRPRAFAVFAAVAMASLASAVAVRIVRGWEPGGLPGLSFGVIAAVLMVFGGLYAARRKLMVWPFVTAQDWLQFHIYGSTLAAIFVWIHIGFHFPHGQFGWWLLGLTMWTTVSGLVGIVLQKWIPSLIAAQLSVEVIYERIPEMLDRLRNDAASTMEGASDALRRFYETEVQPALVSVSPSWAHVFDAGRDRYRYLASFEHIQAFVDDDDQNRLSDLKSILSEKLEIEAHYSLQRILRFWPVLHVPPALMLLAAIAVHIAAVWYF